MFGKRLASALPLAAMVLYQGLHSDAGGSVDQQTVGGRTMRDGQSELIGAASATMAPGAGGEPSASVRKGTVGGRSASVLSSKMRAAAKKRKMIIAIVIAIAILLVVVTIVGVVLYKKYKAPKPKSGAGCSGKPGDEQKKLAEGEKAEKPKTDGGLDGKSGKRTGTGEKSKTPTTGSTSGTKDKRGSKDPEGPTPTIGTSTDTSVEDKGKCFEVEPRTGDMMIEFWLEAESSSTHTKSGSEEHTRTTVKAAIEVIFRKNENEKELQKHLKSLKERAPQAYDRLMERGFQEVHDWLKQVAERAQDTELPASPGPEAAKACLAPVAEEGVKQGIEHALHDLGLPEATITAAQANNLDDRYQIDDRDLAQRIASIGEACKQTDYSTSQQKSSEATEFTYLKQTVQMSAGKMRHLDRVLGGIGKEKLDAILSCTPDDVAAAEETLKDSRTQTSSVFSAMQLMYNLPNAGNKGEASIGAMTKLVGLCHREARLVHMAKDYVFKFARDEAYNRVIKAIRNIPSFHETVTKMKENAHLGGKKVKPGLLGDGHELACWMDRREFARGTGPGIDRESD